MKLRSSVGMDEGNDLIKSSEFQNMSYTDSMTACEDSRSLFNHDIDRKKINISCGLFWLIIFSALVFWAIYLSSNQN